MGRRHTSRRGSRTVDFDVGTRPYEVGARTPPGSDPDVWTGSAPVPGPVAEGWTSPYEIDTDPEPGMPDGGPARAAGRPRWGLFAVVAGTVVAVVVLAVAAVLPKLHGLGLGSASTTATHAPVSVTQQTVTVEAESPDNSLSGSARIGAYQGASGGRLVRAIGTWGGAKGPGALRFNNVVVGATGRYAVKFYFVNIKGQASRTVVITTDAGDPVDVTVTNGTSICCDSQQVEVQLQQGSNSITFANPDGEAPAIDRIIVSAP